MTGDSAAIIAKDQYKANPTNSDTFFLGIKPDSKTAIGRYTGIWWENGRRDKL